MSQSPLNLKAVLEPKGIIRSVEFLTAILAFTTCCGYTGSGSFQVVCPGITNLPVSFSFSYPFRLTEDIRFSDNVCANVNNKNQTVSSPTQSESASQFFVFVGVWSFLTCIASVILYVFFDAHIQVRSWMPKVDFIHSLVIVFLWLIATSAWLRSLNDMKTEVDSERFMMLQPTCKVLTDKCQVTSNVDFTTLNASIVS